MSLLDKLKSDLEGIRDVDFEDVGEFIKVTVAYQAGKEGKDRWTMINKVVKQYGGEWVPEGWSHWKIPKNTPQTPLKQDRIYEAIDLLEKALTKLREAGY